MPLAWAMLFQMMERLHAAVAKRELTLIDPEDPVAGAAVSSILNDLAKRPSFENGQLKVRWIHFVRGISAMHTASDAGNADALSNRESLGIRTDGRDPTDDLVAENRGVLRYAPLIV